jgi:type II secretory pathway pseudopilin PulG
VNFSLPKKEMAKTATNTNLPGSVFGSFNIDLLVIGIILTVVIVALYIWGNFFVKSRSQEAADAALEARRQHRLLVLENAQRRLEEVEEISEKQDDDETDAIPIPPPASESRVSISREESTKPTKAEPVFRVPAGSRTSVWPGRARVHEYDSESTDATSPPSEMAVADVPEIEDGKEDESNPGNGAITDDDDDDDGIESDARSIPASTGEKRVVFKTKVAVTRDDDDRLSPEAGLANELQFDVEDTEVENSETPARPATPATALSSEEDDAADESKTKDSESESSSDENPEVAEVDATENEDEDVKEEDCIDAAEAEAASETTSIADKHLWELANESKAQDEILAEVGAAPLTPPDA